MENFVDNVENFLNTINADKKGNLKRNKNFLQAIDTIYSGFLHRFQGLSTNLDKVIHKV